MERKETKPEAMDGDPRDDLNECLKKLISRVGLVVPAESLSEQVQEQVTLVSKWIVCAQNTDSIVEKICMPRGWVYETVLSMFFIYLYEKAQTIRQHIVVFVDTERQGSILLSVFLEMLKRLGMTEHILQSSNERVCLCLNKDKIASSKADRLLDYWSLDIRPSCVAGNKGIAGDLLIGLSPPCSEFMSSVIVPLLGNSQVKFIQMEQNTQ